MATLAKLVVAFEAQTAKYERKLESMNRKLGRFEKRQRNSLANIKKAFQILASAAAVRQIIRMGDAQIRAADSINKLTDRLGGATEAWSELIFVGERAGVQQNQLTLGLQRMIRRVAEAAQGFGEAKAALRQLGLDARQLTQLSFDQQFEIIAQALSEVEEEGRRTALAMKLFDSEGVKLLQTMTNGAAGIREVRDEARALGVTLSQEQADAATKAANGITNLTAQLDAMQRNITVSALPAINAFADGLQRIFNQSLEQQADELMRAIFIMNQQIQRLNEGSPERPILMKRLFELQLQLESVRKKMAEVTDKAIPVAVAETVKLADVSIKAADGFDLLGAELDEFKRIAAETNTLTPFTADQIFSMSDVIDKAIESMEKAEEKTEELEDAAGSLGFVFQSAFEDAIIEGEKLRDVLRGLAQDILRIIIRKQITEPIANFIGGLFGGKGKTPAPRAFGGPVRGGVPYLVGERGPELFVPPGSGQIKANGALGGALVVNIDAKGADADRVMALVPGLVKTAVDQSVGKMYDLRTKGRF